MPIEWVDVQPICSFNKAMLSRSKVWVNLFKRNKVQGANPLSIHGLSYVPKEGLKPCYTRIRLVLMAASLAYAVFKKLPLDEEGTVQVQPTAFQFSGMTVGWTAP